MFKGEDAQATLILENFLSKYENASKKLPTVKGKVVATSDAVVMKGENMMVNSNSFIISGDDQNGTLSPEQLQKFTEKLENTKNTSLAYAKLASLYEKRGDFEKALETVEKAIKIDPTDANSLGVRGKIKTSMKDYNGAYEDLSTAIRSLPSFPNYYLDRGILLLLMNKDEEAQKDFDKYLTIVPPGNARTYMKQKIAEAKKKRELID